MAAATTSPGRSPPRPGRFREQLRDGFLVALLGCTGERISEALGLRRQDMHLRDQSRPAPITAEPLSDVVPLDLTAWTHWLQDQVDPLWRPGEWSQQAWFFDGDVDNPRTSASKCITTSCWTVMPSRGLLCRHCLEAHKTSTMSREEFAATYERPRWIRTQWGSERETCVLAGPSGRCERPAYGGGLCPTHYSRWRRRSDQQVTVEEWLATTTAEPLEAKPTCIVRGCFNQRAISGLCTTHLQRWDREKRAGATRDPEQWAGQAATRLLANQFTLRGLADPVRWEFLYGLQRRDARGGVISRKYLFPSITDRSGIAHMGSSLANAMREWVAAIPVLLSDELDEQGNRLPFDRSLIFPYAFRHAYAQRHADAGVPVDVLKELMDHRSIVTTMSYYQVSLKRKREAITTMRKHTIDRSGRPAPFTSTTDYEAQSVAVPFGNCREPSNVKAGGKACAIRFQCAGCGFYRPDPSYLPAIEEHVNDLWADRETAKAMDADDFVVRNLVDQITAFTNVADTMRDRLSSLPQDEREEIEEASAVLRKVRATRDHKLLPLTVIRKEAPDAC